MRKHKKKVDIEEGNDANISEHESSDGRRSINKDQLHSKKPFGDLNFNWLDSSALSDTYQVLTLFRRGDQQFEIIAKIACNLGWKVSPARSLEEALELFQLHSHDLVIVDRRGMTRANDADAVCSAIMRMNVTRTCNIVALVKRSFFTAPGTDTIEILNLLQIGYTRALMECSHEGILMNELIGIYANECQPKDQLAASQLLYQVVDKYLDIVHVTDHNHTVQFANKASEEWLGVDNEQIIGKSYQDLIGLERLKKICLQIDQGNVFVGRISFKGIGHGAMLKVKVVTIHVTASEASYYAYMYDSSHVFDATSSNAIFQAPSPTGSFDVRSASTAGHKRVESIDTSNDIIDANPLDNQVSKVIALLSAAIEDSTSPATIVPIENAIAMLRNMELFSPRIGDKDWTTTDHTALDFFHTYISAPKIPTRKPVGKGATKKSTIVSVLQASKASNVTRSLLGPEELEELLETGFDWDFDIFKLEYLTDGRPLYFLGMTLMQHYKVAEKLECDIQTLQNWLTTIEANYNSSVSYHNSTHATDVLQALARFMRHEKLQMILEPMDEIAALLAACAHDVGHPGKSSQFLCNANDKLAILYNDLTVLENHHSALMFQLTLTDENVNIFKNLDRDSYQNIRHIIIDMILATEMTKHFEHLAKFVNLCNTRANDLDPEFSMDDTPDTAIFLLPDNMSMTKRMIIKCADVSNPTRPWRHYVEWTRRIAKEYFDQTDDEKKSGLPVVMPMFDRSTCSIPKSQIGFVDYIINDMMEAWDSFIDMPELIGNMRLNYENWKHLSEEGIMTLEDIEKLQEDHVDLRILRK